MNMGYGYQGAPMQPGYFNANYAPPMQAQQASTPPQNVNWVYVNGIGGAREQIVQPGGTAWMMDNNDPVIYVKAVDSMGSATLRGFRLTEIDMQNPQGSGQAASNEVSALSVRLEKLERDYRSLVDALGGGVRNESVGTDRGEAGGR